MTARRALLAFFVVFLFFPYGILLYKISLAGSLDTAELWWAFKNTFNQALGSTFGSLLSGLWLCLGFLKFQRSVLYRPWMGRLFEVLLLLPSFLPPLFILLVLLSLVDPFPTGLVGVTLAHIVMNAGLVALIFKSLFETKMKPLLEIATVEGSSQWLFLRSSWGMAKRDIYATALFVFILCFTSFSIPMIAGGGKATTLEILIYEKIRISNAWSEALSLSFIQLLIVMLLSLIPFSPRKKLFGRSENLPLLGSFSGVFALFLYSFGLISYFFYESYEGWTQVLRIPGLWQKAVELVPISFLLALSVGGVIACLLLLSASLVPFRMLHRLISGMISPSTALLGFALLFFFSNDEPWTWLKWILGFSYLIFATLYRWGWDQEVSGISDQVLTAETLGASRSLIFQEILFPQLLKPVTRIAAVASLWALGDFALAKIVISSDSTLALLIETLMSSYRLEAAMALMGLLLLMGAGCFLFFWGISYVGRRKFE